MVTKAKEKEISIKEISIEELTMQALIQARGAFEDCISNEGYDSAYWDLKLTSWLLGTNFERLQKIELEGEIKKEE